jgi:hypothetical protein
LFVGDLSYADNYPNHDNVRWDTWGRFVERSVAYQPWIWTAGNHEIDFAPEIVSISHHSLSSNEECYVSSIFLFSEGGNASSHTFRIIHGFPYPLNFVLLEIVDLHSQGCFSKPLQA